MKEKFIKAHMSAAYVYAKLSSCKRRQVGCVIIKDNSIIAIGYNGTDPGGCNDCEDKDGKTLPTVRHAEDNALRKLTKSTNHADGAVAFVTTAPCRLCASRIKDAGITTVYYDEIYHSDEGIRYLQDQNIKVIKVKK